MSNLAVRVENLSKVYHLGKLQQSHDTLRDALVAAVRTPMERIRHFSSGTRVEDENTIRALDDVSFEIERGQTVGIIGRNGAGKSTLLKILSRITEATGGNIELYGRVGSLLEVGTGFHPELTGRENIYLNGAILGMRRVEIGQKFDEIVAFAEVERFLDTPVKYYSSGMYVRLAFSVAAFLESEILIIDEVLAVGDAAFQRKCLGKMGDIAKQGRTVLFVSHNMSAVQQLTRIGLLLDRGRLVCHGAIAETIAHYVDLPVSQALGVYQGKDLERVQNDLSRRVEFRRLEFDHNLSGVFAADSDLSIRIEVLGNEDVEKFRFSLTIFQIGGSPVGSVFGAERLAVQKNKVAVFTLTLRNLRLAPGKYYFGMATGKGSNREGHIDFDIVNPVLHFEVAPPEGVDGTMASWSPYWGPVRLSEPSLVCAESNAG